MSRRRITEPSMPPSMQRVSGEREKLRTGWTTGACAAAAASAAAAAAAASARNVSSRRDALSDAFAAIFTPSSATTPRLPIPSEPQTCSTCL